MQLMMQTGRHRTPHGVEHPLAKLSEADAQTIKGFKGTVTQRELAEAFGVTQSTVCRIQTGKKWPHLGIT